MGLGAASEKRLTSVPTELGLVGGTWEGKEAQGPSPFLPRHDHTPGPQPSAPELPARDWEWLVWKGEGSGGGRRGAVQSRAALLFSVHLPCSHHFSSAPPPYYPPQPAHCPHLCHLSPTPTHPNTTCVGQHLPPHSIDHSASPPGSPRVHLSILPSVPAPAGLRARESLTPCLLWWGPGVAGCEGRGWKEGAVGAVGGVEVVLGSGLGKLQTLTPGSPLTR